MAGGKRAAEFLDLIEERHWVGFAEIPSKKYNGIRKHPSSHQLIDADLPFLRIQRPISPCLTKTASRQGEDQRTTKFRIYPSRSKQILISNRPADRWCTRTLFPLAEGPSRGRWALEYSPSWKKGPDLYKKSQRERSWDEGTEQREGQTSSVGSPRFGQK